VRFKQGIAVLRESCEAILHWLKRVITQPRHELSRLQRTVRFAYDLGRFGAKQLQYDRAPQMAAALSFRALFGLVPVLIVALVAVRALIGVDEFLALILQLLTWAQLDQVSVTLPGAGDTTSQPLSDWMRHLIGEAASVRIAAIGWIGMAVVIYAALGLLVDVEKTFNIIYRAPEGRSWIRRAPVYWFLLTVCPLMIGLGLWLNSQFAIWVETAAGWQGMPSAVRFVWSLFCGWLLLLSIYILMPNTTVRLRPAAIGALVGVILLEIGKRLLGVALGNAFAVSQLYGSLGLIPLFMFWVYLMCLALLFGLQVSATLQMLRGRQLEEIERRQAVKAMIEPASLITVMEIIADRFNRGLQTTTDELSEAMSISRTAAGEILERLIEAGMLHPLGQDNDAVCLARSPDQIKAAELIEIGFQIVDDSGTRRSAFFDRLRSVQRELAARETLAALLPPSTTA